MQFLHYCQQRNTARFCHKHGLEISMLILMLCKRVSRIAKRFSAIRCLSACVCRESDWLLAKHVKIVENRDILSSLCPPLLSMRFSETILSPKCRHPASNANRFSHHLVSLNSAWLTLQVLISISHVRIVAMCHVFDFDNLITARYTRR